MGDLTLRTGRGPENCEQIVRGGFGSGSVSRLGLSRVFSGYPIAEYRPKVDFD